MEKKLLKYLCERNLMFFIEFMAEDKQKCLWPKIKSNKDQADQSYSSVGQRAQRFDLKCKFPFFSIGRFCKCRRKSERFLFSKSPKVNGREFWSHVKTRGYSSVVEHSTADREVRGSTPRAPFKVMFLWCLVRISN